MKGLLFITHTTEKYDTVDSAHLALKGGCRHIQLRMKDTLPADVLSVGIEVKKLCDAYNAALYINDHPSICKELKATGVHLGKNDMSPCQARELLGNDYIIGGTANSRGDIQRLYSEGVDYIGLGPFRFTTTKKNLSPVLGLEGYRELMESCRQKGISLPVFAIGGIMRADIPALMQTGVSGIALSSSILQAEDPVQETREFIKIINQ